MRGRSMTPTLDDGDTVVVDPGAYDNADPSPGEVVLCRHPFRTDVQLVKRVSSVGPDGELMLVGDNPAESTDSGSLSAVPRVHLKGQVMGRIRHAPA